MLPQDKANHVIYGYGISAIAILATMLLGPSSDLVAPTAGLIAALGAALLKDFVYDKIMGKGTFDLKDILATVCGGAIPAVTFLIVK